MKAVVYVGKGQLSVEDVPRPQIAHPRDAIVKVTSTAICGSDIHLKHMDPSLLVEGQIIGHEFVGIVEEVGEWITDLRPGDRVVGSCSRYCGYCEYCRQGLYAHCADFACLGAHPQFDGVQAEYARIPYADRTLLKVRSDLLDEQAIFVGDILSTGYMAAEYGEIAPGKTVAIWGAGPVGICAMLCCRMFTPGQIIVIEPNMYRRNLCLRRGLADCAIDPLEANPVEAIWTLTGFKGAHTCIEAIGREDTINQAMASVRPSGNVTTIGFFTEPVRWELGSLWVKNMTIRHGFVQTGYMETLLTLIENSKLDASFLATHAFPLTDALEGYDLFENRADGVLKVILKP